MTKVRNCTDVVDVRGRKLRERYRDDIKRCGSEIEQLQGHNSNVTVRAVTNVKAHLSSLFQEETFWKQRANVYWLKDEETNSN